ncbi:Ig-like domain-containing protein [Bifidobacterium samirii]|uniref:Bacterial Ig-like domain (Group 4) n=1 Tax=Bifidobacterium samirii TaxID=2306974 RepID=A0A430FRD1_9BIFI|nr:Ig-like domain-containing protein [Bifidobacterium samirii]RSX55415.1 Bacterial Ig-like domain (group 4) [Bifidobacterium samirii]
MRATTHRIWGGIAAIAGIAMLFCALPAEAATGWSTLSDTEKKSSYGYFVWKSEHASDSAERQTAKEAAELLLTAHFKDDTNIGAADDATALANMEVSIQQIIAINEFRSSLTNEPCRTDLAADNPARACDDNGDGLTPLKVTDKMMAASQSNVNYSSHQFGHASNNGQQWNFALENLHANSSYNPWTSDGQSTAAKSWYAEIANYDDHPLECGSSQQIGHYRTLTNKICFANETSVKVHPFSTTGLAIAKHARWQSGGIWRDYPNGMTVSQVYGGMQGMASSGYEYDAADYLADFQSYIAKVKTIASVTKPATVTVDSSTTKPTDKLPKTVTVTYDDGTTGTVDVAWEEIPDDWNQNRAEHDAHVHGDVDGYLDGTDLTLHVRAATVTGVTVANTKVTTASGTAPKLDTTAKATWSNGDTTDETVAWQSDDSYKNRDGGAYDVTGTVTVNGKNHTVTTHVTVTKATAKSVAQPAAATIIKGGAAPTIPATAKVTWSNGDATDEPIVWDAGADPNDATFDKAETYTFTGKAAGLKVTWKVAVAEASITKAYDPDPISVQSGTDPTGLLPKTVKAELSNGKTEQVPVVWEAVPDTWKNREGGSFTLTGVVGQSDAAVTAAVDDQSVVTVTLTVTVTPATIADVTVDPAELTTPAGVDPTDRLPKTATVTWSNGDTTTDVAVAWNAIDKTAYATKGASFDATGTVSVDGRTAEASVKVTVGAPIATGATVSPASVSTIATHAPDLSKVVATVAYSDGTSATAAVQWNEIKPAQYAAAGSFEATGTVGVDGASFDVTVTVTVAARTITAVTPAASVPAIDTAKDGAAPAVNGDVTVVWNDGAQEQRTIALTLPDGWNHPRDEHQVTANGRIDGWEQNIPFTVTVNAATAESAAALPDVRTPQKTVPTLPASVDVTWSNGDVTGETIAWDMPDKSAFDTAGDTPVTITGKAAGLDVTIRVTVVPATITGVDAPTGTVTTDAGTKPTLPATVTAHWSNGDTSDVAVTWAEFDGYTKREGGDFTVTGTIAGWDGTVSVNVHVNPATATAAAIDPDSSTITVESGTAPTLPKTATVTWSDGGDTTAEAVTWDAFDGYKNRDGGDFTVHGTAAGLDVTVSVHVNPATQVSVENGGAVNVSTTVGKKPTLPATLSVTWSNGDVTAEPVTWTEYDESWIATAGTFTVAGKVGGFTAAATVTVTKADSGSGDSGSGDGTSTKPGDAKPGTTGTKPQSDKKTPISSTGAAVLSVAVVAALLVAAATAILTVKRKK